jgi:drug/metabolite transporter (DMT)-like permease
MPTPSRTAIITAFAAIYLIWGSTYLAIRVAVETMPPFLMAGSRFLIAGGLLAAFLKFRGAPWPTPRQWRDNAITGTFLLLGGNGTVVWAEQYLPSGITALLVGIGPLAIVLMEWAWPGGLRPTLRTMAALLLGLAGVAWLAAPWESAHNGGLDPRATGILLSACVFWSFGAIYTRHARSGADSFAASAMQMLCGGVALCIAALFNNEFTRLDLPRISGDAWLAYGYLIGVGSLIGFSTFVWLMKHCPPAQVSTYAYVNPIVAVFLGWLILDESITRRTIIAAGVIITSVIIITLEKQRTKKA